MWCLPPDDPCTTQLQYLKAGGHGRRGAARLHKPVEVGYEIVSPGKVGSYTH